MTRSIMGGLLLSAALAASGGCNVCRAILYDPFGPNTLCDARRCGRVVEEPCGPMCGPMGPPAVMDEPGVDESCDPCGPGPCRCRRGLVRGPLAFVFALFTAGSYRGCYGGCGERYWGDWYGDPPECCDPCDGQGNFIGGGASWGGGPGPAEMNGAEVPVVASPGGCRSCGQGGHATYTRGPSQNPAYFPSYSRQYAGPSTSGIQRSAAPAYDSGPRAPAWQASRGSRPTAQSYYPSSPSRGPQAPRLISTTDRVVAPGTTDAGPRLAQPQRSGVVQE